MLTIEQVDEARRVAHKSIWYALSGIDTSDGRKLIDDICDLAIRQLTTPSSGWKRVPELPTVEMCNAGENAISSGRHGLQINVASVYRAMLNASPTVEVEG